MDARRLDQRLLVFCVITLVGDFDEDSDPDLAVANWNGDNVSVLLNRCTCPGDASRDGEVANGLS